jgi:UDP-N-acetyl-D-mannosaminuronic acid dehydrogenase
MRSHQYDVAVVGGCGHVGLPLAIAFAASGLRVVIQDVSELAVKKVRAGELPFREEGAQTILDDVLASGRLEATTDAAVLAESAAVVVVIGTPVDEHLNPDPHAVTRAICDTREHLRDGQLIVLRSTVYPGVTRRVSEALAVSGLDVDIAFCPERIAEGRAMTELHTLPQIVAGTSERARSRAMELFGRLTQQLIELEPEEAELAKLFTNTWRYLKFAAANQFFVMANDHGLDYARIRAAITADYPRAADLPGAGFAAGPCLFKDTMQLAAFSDNTFVLGHSAMLVNEGLPLYVVSRLEQRFELRDLTIGILGMAFKAQSDDIRSSLSYKLKRILEFRAGQVLCTDPYVTVDADLHPVQYVLAQSDIVIIAAPHDEYRSLEIGVPVVDIWNHRGSGTVV